MDDNSENDSINRPQRRIFKTRQATDCDPVDNQTDPPQPDTPVGYSERQGYRHDISRSRYSIMHKLRLNDLVQLNDPDDIYDGIDIRVRRVSSGWLYEYMKEDDDVFSSVVFVPYSDENPEKQREGDKVSFMYRLNLNQKTGLFGRISGLAEDSSCQIWVRRVPGGWIYEYYNAIDQDMDTAAFVAMNDYTSIQN